MTEVFLRIRKRIETRKKNKTTNTNNELFVFTVDKNESYAMFLEDKKNKKREAVSLKMLSEMCMPMYYV